MRIVVILTLCFLTACGTLPPADNLADHKLPPLPLLEDRYFGEPLAVATVADIFTLTENQQKDFIRKMNTPAYRALRPSRQIYRYIENQLANFSYHADTFNATDTLRQSYGNCLSLAILTKSLANLSQADIAYELVETPPVYQREGGMLLSSQHIRTVLTDPRATRSFGKVNLFQGKLTVDYFPVSGTRALRMVEENEFYAMYYRNIAAEAMVDKNTNLAFWNLKQALKLKPDDAHAINMMGLLHVRLGFPDYAEKLYLYGLELGTEKLELLNNYHTLLKSLGRTEDARLIAIKLKQYDDPNPFKWIQLADRAYADKDYRTAITYYSKAARMADYLHEPYAGIARSQFMLGNKRSARAAMKTALENSHQDESTALYEAKYKLFSGNL